MTNWDEIESKVRKKLKNKNITDANLEIKIGLEEFPNHSDLLSLAIEVCRAANDHEKALEYADLLIIHHPEQWIGYGFAAEELLTLQRFEEAQTKVHAGLEKFPNEVYFLTIANHAYRASGDRKKSLAYANLLIKHHPDLTSGYILSAQDSIELNHLNEAQSTIQTGLERIPNNIDLLNIAIEVCRAANDHEKALEYADLLIIHYPEQWVGYGFAAEELLTLQRFEEAQTKVHAGLEKFPNEVYFLTIANHAYRASGNRKKSLAYANLLIKHHPNLTSGYILSTQDSIELNHLNEAQSTIQTGLERIPNNIDLLSIAIEVFRAAYDHEKALEYADLLINYYPEQWIGYSFAAEDLVALKKFNEAQNKIQAGLHITKNRKLLTMKENLSNDIANLNILNNNQINSQYLDSIESHLSAKKINTNNDENEFCILLRCKNYQDKLVQDLSNLISEHTNNKNIWFVHDSDEEKISNNIISVQKFRQSMGIDWSIIDQKGWLFGDFCYYAAINAGLSYNKYYLIEEDVRFSGQALSLFLEDTLNQATDFICAKFAKADRNWQWLESYSYSHPNENSEYQCLFPISSASNSAIKFLFAKRIAEFKFFVDNHEFSRIEAKKYFSNDEAFTCNSIANSLNHTICGINESLVNKYFGLNTFNNILSISGDHIIHKYKT